MVTTEQHSGVALHGVPERWYEAPCRRCGRNHRLLNDGSLALETLTGVFTRLASDPADAELRRALDVTRGKMVGALVGEARDGSRQLLRAFSGDLGGRSDWPGWAPSIMRREATAELEAWTLQRIAELDARMEPLSDGPARQQLRAERRQVSATLMAAMFDAMGLTNAHGERHALRDVFCGGGIPSGTGECAVPKLLEAANQAGLRPVAIAEAWWGPTLNGRRHGDLQPACARKCMPILGHLLCGANGA